MPRLVQIFFSEETQPTLCDPKDVEILTNDFCMVRDTEGRELVGFVGGFEHICEAQMTGRAMPVVLRRAQSSEVRAWHMLKKREVEGLNLCREKVSFHKLDMKVTRILFEDTMHKVIFFFTADQRVDFRDLVKDLASLFHARIELWQVGVRDEARVIGGLGGCGHTMCCSTWMRDFVPVSIRYAKVQDIQFSPTKLSGMCGRLRCCLSYEQKQYQMLSKGVPPVGSTVQMENMGEAKVVDRNLLARTLTLYSAEGKHTTIQLSQYGRIKAVHSESRTCKGQVVWEVKEGRPDDDDKNALFLEEEPDESEVEMSDREFAALTARAEKMASGGDISEADLENEAEQIEQRSQSARQHRRHPQENDAKDNNSSAATADASERPRTDRKRRRNRPANKQAGDTQGKDAPKAETQSDGTKSKRRRSRGGGRQRPGNKPEGGGDSQQNKGDRSSKAEQARPAAKKERAKQRESKPRPPRSDRRPARSTKPSE